MDGINAVELIGYLGSVLVLVSMVMTSVIRLRVINLTGSVIFAAYALMIRSYPTAVMNICLAGVNIYHLVRLLKEQKHYDLIKTDLGDGYVSYLLEHYAEDIRACFPEFSLRGTDPDLVLLVCCDSNPAGVFLGRTGGKGAVDVVLDYATPVYRDTSVGRYLHGQLARQGYETLTFRAEAPRHTAYMEKVGYEKQADGAYTLNLRH
jgi:hypothetical protein